MCDYEEFEYTCSAGCSAVRLRSDCHWRRNNKDVKCMSVKVLKKIWVQEKKCPEAEAGRPCKGPLGY
ncbi:hypothetical protein V8F06_001654 [Rhypophila decipiens]